MTNLHWLQLPKTFASRRCSRSVHPSRLRLDEGGAAVPHRRGRKPDNLSTAQWPKQHRVVQQNWRSASTPRIDCLWHKRTYELAALRLKTLRCRTCRKRSAVRPQFLTAAIRREMKRRTAIEPVTRATSKGIKGWIAIISWAANGDRANAVLAAAGYNLSLLLLLRRCYDC